MADANAEPVETGPGAAGEALARALEAIGAMAGTTTVVKYGGAAMTDAAAKAETMRDLALLSKAGLRIVLVHGGGPEIDAMLGRLGVERRFAGGLRVTDEATMEVVQMVLAGKVNKDLVAGIEAAGGRALGLCGADGGLLRARKLARGELDLGRVGEVSAVDPAPLLAALGSGYLPVVATVALAEEDGGLYNVNADTAAAELAAALGAERLVLLTDVPGILRDVKDPGSLIRELARSELDSLAREGILSGGMIPKVECCARALDGGAKSAVIADGRKPHALLASLAGSGAGTVLR